MSQPGGVPHNGTGPAMMPIESQEAAVLAAQELDQDLRRAIGYINESRAISQKYGMHYAYHHLTVAVECFLRY